MYIYSVYAHCAHVYVRMDVCIGLCVRVCVLYYMQTNMNLSVSQINKQLNVFAIPS